uniref:IS110 family transposase n=1 Tax=Streptomyces minutiscleroticus TaxID=68238 RepID=UPI001E2D272C|nr:transposase [Streptomyces minutiscleroticus]
MNAGPTPVIGGIDTHTDFHQLAVIDTVGRQLATKSFRTIPDGYRHLLRWLRTHGEVLAVGMESTGHYGAELARFLHAHDIRSSRSTGPTSASATSMARPTPWTPTALQPPSCPAAPKAPRRAITASPSRYECCARPGSAPSRPALRRSTRSAL